MADEDSSETQDRVPLNDRIYEVLEPWVRHYGVQGLLEDLDDAGLEIVPRERDDWRQAEGALKGVGPDEPAEVTIRRWRDA
jgi:hypothetical protein